MATFNTELQRDGPGLLLRDLSRGEDAQILSAQQVLIDTAPDIVVLQGLDYDLGGAALSAFQMGLRGRGLDYPYSFAARPNTGMPTGLDMDGDGKPGDPRDAQGYGRFSGEGGMAVLSRFPILTEKVQDFSAMLWKDLPGALLPGIGGAPYPSAEALAIQRLSTTAHWVVPVDVPDIGPVWLLTFYATPPVFDGPEDRNGRRNHDEITFWQHYLAGTFGAIPADRFILLGDANQDPRDGEGRKEAITGLLADPRLQDPVPKSAGGAASGDAFDTVDWDDPDPGNLRVDYVLPSADWTILGSGVHWPAAGMTGHDAAVTASRHRLVWVDLGR